MNARILMIGSVLMLAFAFAEGAWASEAANSENERCQSIGSPASAFVADDMRKRMRESIAQGDWRYIRPLIWDGANPDWTRNTKWHKRAVQEGLNRDLVHAAAIGNEQLISKLIHLGANVNVKPDYDDYMPPLIWAARCDQVSAARLLLDKGADVNITAGYDLGSTGFVEGSTALTWAVSYGNIGVVKVLLARGANPNAQVKVIFDIRKPHLEQNGNTALLQSANNDTVEYLLRAKADPNLVGVDGISPLMKAASNGDLDRCKLLLSWGANPRLKDKNGQTAADLAEQAGHREIEELLRRLR